jgi:hypothetical protein
VAAALRATRSLWPVPPDPDLLTSAGLLHDLGKVLLPRAILLAPRAPTPDETAQVQRHTVLGLELLPLSVSEPRLLDAVAHHHERWDGSGYPLGLRGTQIPFIARLLAVVDAFDAITSPRPYSPARTRAEALAELRSHTGTQFDPDLAVACCDLFDLADSGADHPMTRQPLPRSAPTVALPEPILCSGCFASPLSALAFPASTPEVAPKERSVPGVVPLSGALSCPP